MSLNLSNLHITKPYHQTSRLLNLISTSLARYQTLIQQTPNTIPKLTSAIPPRIYATTLSYNTIISSNIYGTKPPWTYRHTSTLVCRYTTKHQQFLNIIHICTMKIVYITRSPYRSVVQYTNLLSCIGFKERVGRTTKIHLLLLCTETDPVK